MPLPNQDFSKRDASLPDGCKDLVDAIKHEQASALPMISDPPIKKVVVLPDIVSVEYLIEVSEVSAYTMTLVMQEMQVLSNVGRSVDFEVAAKILRKYGIAAIRAAN